MSVTIVNGMASSLVLGQSNFTSGSSATTQAGMWTPQGVAVDPTSGKVFVGEYGNHRVLRFASITALASGAAAEAVLGQPNFTSNGQPNPPSAASMTTVNNVYVDAAGRLWVADGSNHRVLRFDNASSKANGANADGVLGQPNFTSNNAGGGLNQMSNPIAIHGDAAGRIWVGEYGNPRVLRFDNAASKPNGANADGQLIPNLSNVNVWGVYADAGGRLWVTDYNNHRVLRYDNAAAKGSSDPANGVLGQPDFTTTVWGGTAGTQNRMCGPTGITGNNAGQIFVTELGNNRVTVFNNAASKSNGANADLVIGQSSFSVSTANTSAAGFNGPVAAFYDPATNVLLVADRGNHRVLMYGAPSPISATGIWLRIANEGQSFSFPSTQTVRYGISDKWIIKTLTGNVSVNNSFFGNDPAPGIAKVCEIQVTSSATSSGTWLRVANEGQSLSVPIAQTVRYGINDKWVTRTLSGNVDVTNSFFGNDPAPGIAKVCEVLAAPPAAASFFASLGFSGNQVVLVSNTIPLSADWTIETFFSYPLDSADGWKTLVRGSDNHHFVIVNKSGGSERLGTYANGQGEFYDSGYDMKRLSAGWHHLAAVGQGNVTTFYMDGAAVGAVAKRANGNIYAIGNYQGGGQPFGCLAEFRVWSAALSPAEVAANCAKLSLTGSEANLLAYYPMNEGQGATIADKKGGRTGSASNSPTWVTYPSQPWKVTPVVPAASSSAFASLGFSGNQMVLLPNVIPLSADWTIETFFSYPLDSADGWKTLVRGSDNHHFVIVNKSSSIERLGTYVNGQGEFYDSGYDMKRLSAGWHHLAVVGQGNVTTFYIDGATVGAVAKRANGNIYAIGNYQAGGQPFSRLAEFRVWSAALSPMEVAANCAKLSLTGSEANLLAYYPMNEGQGAIITDKKGGRTGSASNSPAWVTYPSQPWKVTPPADTIAPTVSAFAAATPCASLNIPITAFTASDNVAVTGYKITTSSTPPASAEAGWAASAPTIFAVAASGNYSLYPWVKDAAGNVSAVFAAPVQVVVDTTAPTVSAFTAATPSNSLNIPITAFTASDNVVVTGYKITTSATPPAAAEAGWTASAPTTFAVANPGNYTLYPWAKDAVGNVSAVFGTPVSVQVVDTTPPVVNTFAAATPSASLNISITAFTASDNVAVTGYKITTTATPPAAADAGWMASAPSSFAVPDSGTYTLYPWVKDAAGNISTVFGMPTQVLVDTLAPTVSVFSAATPSASLNVPITMFTASDNVAVTGYKITTSATPPSATDSGWTASAPANFAVASSGNYSLYPWVKDAVGNVSTVYGAPVQVVADILAPTVTAFAAVPLSASLNVPITAFSATDNVAVSGYKITTSATPPAATETGWTAGAPTNFAVLKDGTYSLYPWAKDAAGNVSAVFGAPAQVVVDMTVPMVSSFAPAPLSLKLTIPIIAFSATDNIAVSGYKITTSATPPAASDAGWSASPPASFDVPAYGTYLLYPWVKDMVGNVSAVFHAPTSSTVQENPVVVPITSGMPAGLVLGQPNFNRNDQIISQTGMSRPVSCGVDPTSGKVFVLDGGQRILRFARLALLYNGAPAEAVFMQPNFTTLNNSMGGEGLCVDSGGRLWVTDNITRRILRFDNAASLPSGTSTPSGYLAYPLNADARAICVDNAGRLWAASSRGQISRYDNAASQPSGALPNGGLGVNGGGSFMGSYYEFACRGICSDNAGRIWASDAMQSRVLRFDNAASKGFNSPADGVLGCQSFEGAPGASGAGRLSGPCGVTFDNNTGTLYVADTGNYRVLGFNNAASKPNGGNADLLIGPSDFNWGDARGAGNIPFSETWLQPYLLFYDHLNKALWVSGGNRVLVFGVDLGFIRPVVTQFELETAVTTNPIPIKTFKAPDNVKVAGYKITYSHTRPYPHESDWFPTPLQSLAVQNAGTYWLYPWVKDYAGNVSPVVSKPTSVQVITDLTQPKVFVANAGNQGVIALNLDGTNALRLGSNSPSGVAMDESHNKIYYTAGNTIARVNLDGTGEQNLGNLGGLLSQAFGIDLDLVNDKMYIVDATNHTVICASLDGTAPQNLGNLGMLNGPRDIALDVPGGKMYIMSSGNGKVVKANLDGSSPQDLGNLGGIVRGGSGIDLDRMTGKMYISSGDSVVRANLDGTGAENLGNLNNTLNGAFGIAVDAVGGRLYVSNYGDSTISSAKLDGSGGVKLGNGNGLICVPYGVAVGRLPVAVTNAVTALDSNGATLNGTVNAKGLSSLAISFEYGPTTNYGTTVVADQSPVSNSDSQPVSKAISGLNAGITYHYRVRAGSFTGGDRTFTVLDIEAPTVVEFSADSTTTSSTIPITVFNAKDNVAVTGYKITTSAFLPAASEAGWSASAPTSYTLAGPGTYQLYPWAKDAAGNVSPVFGAPVTVTVLDVTRPEVIVFGVDSPTGSLAFNIRAFSASDNVAVTAYLITDSATSPQANDPFWTNVKPTSYVVSKAGNYTLYPWVKDAAGNISVPFGSPAAVLALNNPPAIPLTNGMAASLVLGQPNFSSNIQETSQAGMSSVPAVAVDPTSGKVFVLDGGGQRILRFACLSQLNNGAPAEAVFMQPNFTTLNNNLSGGGLWVDAGGRLWAIDGNNKRILRFDNAASLPSGTSAPNGYLSIAPNVDARVICVDNAGRLWAASSGGQISRYDNAASQPNGALPNGGLGVAGGGGFMGSTYEFACRGICSDNAGRIWVADGQHNRVLRFDNAASKGFGNDADGVLGNSSFAGSLQGASSAGRLWGPMGLAFDNNTGTLYVADSGNYRILGYANAASKPNGGNADLVIGHSDFNWFISKGVDVPISDISLQPRGLSYDPLARALWVNCDSRVLVFGVDMGFVRPTVGQFTAPATVTGSPIPITAFKAADKVKVASYLITTSREQAASGDQNWKATPPQTFAVGHTSDYLLYPWIKDTDGNVSAVFASPVSVKVIVDTKAPKIYVGQYDGTAGVRVVNAEGIGDLRIAVGYGAPNHITIDMRGGKLYFTSGSRVYRVNLDGSGFQEFGNLGGMLTSAAGIGLDVYHGEMYITDRDTGRVIKALTDGTGPRSLGNLGLLDKPQDIAYDGGDNHKIYVVSSGNRKIVRANSADGSNPEDLGNPGNAVTDGSSIELDAVNKKIYISSRTFIVQANFDGTNAKNLGNLNNLLTGCVDIALDVAAGVLYAANDNGVVIKANLDGTNAVTLGNFGGSTLAVRGTTSPILGTGMATSITTDGVTLAGAVNANNNTSVHGFFEVGPTTNYGTRIEIGLSITGIDSRDVSKIINGLAPGTTYHYRIGAGWMDGSDPNEKWVFGLDRTFSTLLDVKPPKLYIANQGNGGLLVSNLNGSGAGRIGSPSPSGVAIDSIAGKAYYTSGGSVFQANLDGTGEKNLGNPGNLLSQGFGIALDLTNGKMYIVDASTHKVIRSNLDGSGAQDLGNLGLLNVPRDIALDVPDNKMYIISHDNNKVVKANLDGSNPQDLGNLGGAVVDASGIDLDPIARRLYIATRTAVIWANLDGTGVKNLGNLNNTLNVGFGIAVDASAGKLYVTNFGDSTISQANLNGTGGVKLGNPGGQLSVPYGIAVNADPTQVPVDSIQYRPAGQWFRVASDGQWCSIPSNQTYRYGAGDYWVVKQFADPVLCDPSYFSHVDPAPGQAKFLEIEISKKIAGRSGAWLTIAQGEGSAFSFPTTQKLRYQWNYVEIEKLITGDGACTAEFFGDATKDRSQDRKDSVCQLRVDAPFLPPLPQQPPLTIFLRGSSCEFAATGSVSSFVSVNGNMCGRTGNTDQDLNIYILKPDGSLRAFIPCSFDSDYWLGIVNMILNSSQLYDIVAVVSSRRIPWSIPKDPDPYRVDKNATARLVEHAIKLPKLFLPDIDVDKGSSALYAMVLIRTPGTFPEYADLGPFGAAPVQEILEWKGYDDLKVVVDPAKQTITPHRPEVYDYVDLGMAVNLPPYELFLRASCEQSIPPIVALNGAIQPSGDDLAVYVFSPDGRLKNFHACPVTADDWEPFVDTILASSATSDVVAVVSSKPLPGSIPVNSKADVKIKSNLPGITKLYYPWIDSNKTLLKPLSTAYALVFIRGQAEYHEVITSGNDETGSKYIDLKVRVTPTQKTITLLDITPGDQAQYGPPNPLVTDFAAATPSSSTVIQISAFKADPAFNQVRITGYKITTTLDPMPAASDTDWQANVPTSFDVADRVRNNTITGVDSVASYSLFPWVKNAAGKVSAVFDKLVQVVVDTRPAPTVSAVAVEPATPSATVNIPPTTATAPAPVVSATLIFKQTGPDVYYVKLDGVLREIAPIKVPAEGRPTMFKDTAFKDPVAPAAGCIFGRPLSSKAAIVREYEATDLYWLDEDHDGRLWRRPIPKNMAEQLVNLSTVNICRLSHIPIGPALQPDANTSCDYENRFALPFVTTPIVEPAPATMRVLSLNGADNFVDVPDANWFEGDFTIEAWVYPRSFNSGSRILDFGNGARNDNIVLMLSSGTTGKPQFSVFKDNVEQKITSNVALPLNTWSHVAATLSGTTATLYINGEAVDVNGTAVKNGTVQQPKLITRTKNYLGRSNWDADRYANMLLAEVRIWSVARTMEQISAQMYQQSHGSDAGLLGYWPLDEIKDRIFRNLGAARLDGVLNGANTPGLEPGPSKIEEAVLALDGKNGHLEIPADIWFDGDFTIEAWVYPLVFSGSARILDFGNGTAKDNIVLMLSSGTSGQPQLSVFNGNAEQKIVSNTALKLNTWSHVAATLSGTTATLYINGQSVVSGAVQRPVKTLRTKNYLGRSNWADAYANMLLADVRIWSHACSQDELATRMYQRLAGNEAYLRGYWPLDSVHSQVVDSGPGRVHAQIKNGLKRDEQGGRVGLDFPATQENYIDVPPDAWFDGDFAIEAWVYPRSFSNCARILDFGNGAGDNNIVLMFSSGTTGKPQLSVFKGSAEQKIISSVALKLNTWSHVAATVSYTLWGTCLATLYINGQTVASNALQQPVNVLRTKNYLGRSNWADAYANMLLADVRIWSVTRSQAEIQANKDRALAGTEPYLRAWWRLDEVRQTDYGPNRKHAVALGGVKEYRSLVESEFLALRPREVITENVILSFDGQDDYVKVPYLAAFNEQNFTLEAWIKPDELTDWASILIKPRAMLWNADIPVAVQIHSCKLQLMLNGKSEGLPPNNQISSQTWRSNAELQKNVWQHVAIVYDGASIRFYINGVLDSNRPEVVPTTTSSGPQSLSDRISRETICIGGGFVIKNLSSSYKGSLSDVRIWNRALPGVEILANLNRRLTGKEEGLVGYWPLNEGAFGTVYSLKASQTTNPLYCNGVGGLIFLLMDGYLRQVSKDVFKNLFGADPDYNKMNYCENIQNKPPFPIGPVLDAGTNLVSFSANAPVYLLDKWMSDMKPAWRRISPEVSKALGFKSKPVIIGSQDETIKIDTNNMLIGPSVSLKQFDKGQVIGAVWASDPARAFDPVPGQVLNVTGQGAAGLIPLDGLVAECTLEVWFKTAEKDAGILTLAESGPDGSPMPNGVALYLFNQGIPNARRMSDVIFNTELHLADNQWHHLAYVEGEAVGGRKLYVDGHLAAGDALPASAKGKPVLVLGSVQTDLAIKDFTGQLCDLRVWGRARTEEEIASELHFRLHGDEPGLLGSWPLDESKGQLVRDISPRRRFVHLNGTWVASDVPAYPRHVFANRRFIEVKLDEPETEITHEFWFKTSNPTGGLLAISQGGTALHDRDIFLKNHLLTAFLSAGQDEVVMTRPPGNLDDNRWHHVAHVFGASVGGQKLYVDGGLVDQGTQTTSLLSTQDTLTIGRTLALPEYFEGELAEIRVWKRALTEKEIRAGMHGAPDPSPELLYYLPLISRPVTPVFIRSVEKVNEAALASKLPQNVSALQQQLAGSAASIREKVQNAQVVVAESAAGQAADEPTPDFIVSSESLAPYLAGMTGWMQTFVEQFVPKSMLQNLEYEVVQGEAGVISIDPSEVKEPRPEDLHIRFSGDTQIWGLAARLEYAEFFRSGVTGRASYKFKLEKPVDFIKFLPGARLFDATLPEGALVIQEPVIIMASTDLKDKEDPEDKVEVNTGLNLYGKVALSNSTSSFIQAVGSLLGDDVDVHATINTLENSYSIEASVEADRTLISGSQIKVELSEVEMLIAAQGKPQTYSFEIAAVLALMLKMGPKAEDLKLTGGLKVEEKSVVGAFTLEAEDDEGWVNPFGIPGLTIHSLAAQVGTKSPYLQGLHGSLRIGDVEGSISILMDAENFVLVALFKRLSILDTMVMTPATLAMYLAIPSGFRKQLNKIFNVALEDVNISIVPRAASIGAIEFKEEGITIAGRLVLWGWYSRILINMSPDNGIVIIEGEIDPIDLKIIKLNKAVLHVRAAPTEIPNVYIAASATFLGFTRSILMNLNESGLTFMFEESYRLSDLAAFTWRTAFTYSGDLLESVGTCDFKLNVNLGKLQLANVSFNSYNSLSFKFSTGAFRMTISGKFRFNGVNVTFPTLTLHVMPDKPDALVAAVIKQLADHADEIIAAVFSGIVDFAIAIAEGLLKFVGLDDVAGEMAKVAKEVFNDTIHATAEACRVLGQTAKEAAEGIKNAFNTTVEEVAKALLYAEYGVDIVADALQNTFNIALDEARDIANKAVHEVEDAAKVIGEGIETAAVVVADGVVVAADAVADGFVIAGTGFVRVMNPTKW